MQKTSLRSRRTNGYVVKRQHVISIFSLIAITLIALLYIGLKVRVNILAKEIDNLHQEQILLTQQNYQLRARVMNLSSYERITRIAQEDLGMIFIQQVFVDDVLPAEKASKIIQHQ
ncbi:cell division protein FtsL [candidate division KSB1 bacterium]|nr:cell division protein FtsL [candidate division KSB1 bacterium]